MKLKMLFFKPVDWIQKKLKNQFIRNLGWLSVAELINRVSRLITTVILARFLSPYDYGLAALVLTSYEFTHVFTRFGIGAKIIQADEEKLESICNGAYWLNWLVALALFIIQCLIAFPTAWFYRDDRLILPLCILSTTYLITPIGRVQSLLIQRENRIKITAATTALQISTANILTAIFAVLGMGMWAIILPKLVTAPIMCFMGLRYHPWRRSKGFTTEGWGEIFRFGVSILGGSLLNTLRDNLDYLIVGRFIGVQALGVYYFAFNAGLGISLSITNSISVALYPHLCAARSEFSKFKQRYFSGLKTIASIIIPFVFLQSSLAPFYVPIVFGEKWRAAGAIPILILICLSAIPRPFFQAVYQLLAAIGKPDVFLHLNIIFTVIFAVALVIGAYWNITGVALAVLLSHILVMPFLIVWASRYVLRSNRSQTLPSA